MSRQIVIIGNGIAGITAARTIRKRSDDRILVISAETEHFFSRTALIYIYLGHLRYEDTKPYPDGFWRDNRIDLRRARVEQIDTAGKRLLLDDDGSWLAYDVLVLATGSGSNMFGWPGQDLPGVQGLYSYPDLELMEANTKGVEHAVIVGGGLIGVEMAEMLLSRKISVTFLVREQAWMDFAFPAAEAASIEREIRRHGIDLRMATELERIVAGDDGRVRSVVTKDGEEIRCGFAGLTVGVHPNTGLATRSGIDCDRGILVDDYLRSSASDVYAIGDCAQVRTPRPGRRPLEPVWYVGRRMGQTIGRTITGELTAYDPGVWFNSAKFFDLEWQVYGDIPANLPDGHETVIWQDPDQRRLIRINHRAGDGAVTGFNLLGVRYRHEPCDRWIRQQSPIREVLVGLGAANFDPELFRQYEPQVIERYNRAYPDNPVRATSRRGLRSLLRVGAGR